MARQFFSALLIFTLSMLKPAVISAAPQASDDKPLTFIAEGTRPLLTITVASAERFLDKTEYVFESAEKPEMFRRVERFLAETLNNLEGFNREKPFGIMGYLPVAIPPLPEFIAFVPVDSIEDATRLVEKAPVVIRKDTEEGRYEVIGPSRTFPVLMKDGYAFIPLGNNPSATILDRELPNPATLLASQTQQFDLSVRLDVDSLPVATRGLLMGLISAGVSTTLQQRDGEPEGAYRIRRTEGERGLEALRMLINECQKLTIGLKVEPEEQAVNIDLVVDALDGSRFLKEIFQSTERQSYFIPLLDEKAAVSLSMSSMMAERDRTAYITMVDGIRMEVNRLIEENKLGAVPDENSPIGQALTAVQSTLQEGHVDVFSQFYRDASGKLSIVWAARVRDGDALAAGLQDAASRLSDVDVVKAAGQLEIGALQHLGVTFHRLIFAAQPPEAVAVFGENVGLTLGIGSTSVWGVIGGDDSISTLTSVMDRLEEASQYPLERQTPPNFRIIANVNQLVEMATIADTAGSKARAEKEQEAAARDLAAKELAEIEKAIGTGNPSSSNTGGRRNRGGRSGREANLEAQNRRNGQIMRDTLAEGDDRIEVDSRLTETGVRTRIRLEEGFVRIFGRLIAAQFEPREQPVSLEAAPASEQ